MPTTRPQRGRGPDAAARGLDDRSRKRQRETKAAHSFGLETIARRRTNRPHQHPDFVHRPGSSSTTTGMDARSGAVRRHAAITPVSARTRRPGGDITRHVLPAGRPAGQQGRCRVAWLRPPSPRPSAVVRAAPDRRGCRARGQLRPVAKVFAQLFELAAGAPGALENRPVAPASIGSASGSSSCAIEPAATFTGVCSSCRISSMCPRCRGESAIGVQVRRSPGAGEPRPRPATLGI